MSDKLLDEKEVVKVERKLIEKEYQKEFVAEVRRMDKAELKSKLSELATYRNAVISTMARDEELERAKNKVAELKKPYNDDLKVNKLKDRFVALVLEEEFGE